MKSTDRFFRRNGCFHKLNETDASCGVALCRFRDVIASLFIESVRCSSVCDQTSPHNDAIKTAVEWTG
jgi:hypothetical protein